MHEFSVTRSILELCLQEAGRNGLSRVRRINVTLGRFTGFSARAIRFYFRQIEKGTACAGARLVFDEIPIRVKCPACGREREIVEPVLVCPDCGSDRLEITGGREFYVRSIEGE
jgi:hydrogenase nickel incorporation protein HypA/HybF